MQHKIIAKQVLMDHDVVALGDESVPRKNVRPLVMSVTQPSKNNNALGYYLFVCAPPRLSRLRGGLNRACEEPLPGFI
jgi:hypothetical protein